MLDENIIARENIPPFPNSAMDGYAVRTGDTAGAGRKTPVLLTVIDDLPAGKVTNRRLGEKEAIRIMTGAPLPWGADAVVKVEDASEPRMAKRAAQTVKIFNKVRKGENVRWAGESVKRGEKVLKKGAVLRPQEIGMLAALGFSTAKVIPAPRVAIISTGDELQEIGGKLAPGKIRDCNRYSLASLVAEYGGIPIPLGITRDRKPELRARLRKALSCDLVLTSGGISVGKYDLVRKVMHEMSGRINVWQVAMKPGKPLSFGTIHGTPVFGLPGNPVSVIVSFWQFVRPALLKIQGKKKLKKPFVEAVLTEDCDEVSERTHLVRAVVTRAGEKYFARPAGDQGSGILRSLVMSNALLLIPPGRGPLKKGERIRVMLVEEPEID